MLNPGTHKDRPRPALTFGVGTGDFGAEDSAATVATTEAFRCELADVTGTIERAIRVAAVRPEFMEIVIRYDHQGLTRSWFDPKGLQQAVTSGALNACEALPPESGRVQVTSSARHDGLEIHLSDNGPGIPEP